MNAGLGNTPPSSPHFNFTRNPDALGTGNQGGSLFDDSLHLNPDPESPSNFLNLSGSEEDRSFLPQRYEDDSDISSYFNQGDFGEDSFSFSEKGREGFGDGVTRNVTWEEKGTSLVSEKRVTADTSGLDALLGLNNPKEIGSRVVEGKESLSIEPLKVTITSEPMPRANQPSRPRAKQKRTDGRSVMQKEGKRMMGHVQKDTLNLCKPLALRSEA